SCRHSRGMEEAAIRSVAPKIWRIGFMQVLRHSAIRSGCCLDDRKPPQDATTVSAGRCDLDGNQRFSRERTQDRTGDEDLRGCLHYRMPYDDH
ncbi:hypothetical protein PMAYCL1PPCAC_28164, partial [Pristionchus mayeri]